MVIVKLEICFDNGRFASGAKSTDQCSVVI